MNDILNKTIVLVLNRNWQAINIRTPQEAFCQMATNVATGLDIEGENQIRPVTWEEWITLPIREGDNAVQTARRAIRVPTVIVAALKQQDSGNAGATPGFGPRSEPVRLHQWGEGLEPQAGRLTGSS